MLPPADLVGSIRPGMGHPTSIGFDERLLLVNDVPMVVGVPIFPIFSADKKFPKFKKLLLTKEF